jgi:hypothetical protein
VGNGVGEALVRVLPPHAEVVFLAGPRYREHLETFLSHQQFRVLVPMRGLPIGKQLEWLKHANER